jgi:hypothetical protein
MFPHSLNITLLRMLRRVSSRMPKKSLCMARPSHSQSQSSNNEVREVVVSSSVETHTNGAARQESYV